ncbi:D-alanine--D-alanine ligase [Desulfosarcina sp.]|uniref:D-alanine--D-alanine ligase family protein n=1 Tax=Desulfosarcina sp. TaxID=2027861 RepID=UPI003970576B
MAMTIGLTYDLRSEYLAEGFSEEETAEFDRDDTVTAIESTIQRLGHRTERIGHSRQLAAALVAGRRWDLVFNIAEGMHGIGREAQVPALLDMYRIPYTFSDPLVMSLSLHKGMTKRVIRDAGVPTSDFKVVERPAEALSVTFAPPYFVKPVAEGTGKGVTPQSIVHKKTDLEATCRRLMDTFRQAVIIEPYLPGREFTTGIVGTGPKARVLGTIEVHLLDTAEQGVYSYVNKEECESRVQYSLRRAENDPVVAEAEQVALSAWRALGCRDAGRLDLRCDRYGHPLFIEVNPLAGIHPEHSDLPIICNLLKIPYGDLIGWIIESAATRIEMTNHLQSAAGCI